MANIRCLHTMFMCVVAASFLLVICTVSWLTTTNNICPKRPSTLLGIISPQLNVSNVEYVHSVHQKGKVHFGGWWKPNCISRRKVAILVPYRNRPKQLEVFLNHMHPILQRQMLDYRIFIVEQVVMTFVSSVSFPPKIRLVDSHTKPIFL